MLFICLLTQLKAVDAIAIEAKVTLNEVGHKYLYSIDYDTNYQAKFGPGKGKLVNQRIVSFYKDNVFVGSYLYWQGVGSGLPSAVSRGPLKVEPDDYNEVKITDKFFDLNWHGGHLSKDALSKWFTNTWHIYNTRIPNMDFEYYLCFVKVLPTMDEYLKNSGFTIHGVLEHSFTLDLSNNR